MIRKVLTNVPTMLGKALGLMMMVAAMSGTASARDAVPEIDPGSMATCVALLVGGMMLFGHSRLSAGKVKN